MKEHKLRQKVYHQTQPITDSIYDISKEKIYLVKDFYTFQEIIEDIEKHFKEDVELLQYPAKSFMVSIVYATLISKYFGLDYYESLSDMDLLFGNDPYFVAYSNESKSVYDEVLIRVYPVLINIINDSMLLPSQLKSTIEYFKKEMFIGMELNEVLSIL
jgi:hypothetical protein